MRGLIQCLVYLTGASKCFFRKSLRGQGCALPLTAGFSLRVHCRGCHLFLKGLLCGMHYAKHLEGILSFDRPNTHLRQVSRRNWDGWGARPGGIRPTPGHPSVPLRGPADYWGSEEETKWGSEEQRIWVEVFLFIQCFHGAQEKRAGPPPV